MRHVLTMVKPNSAPVVHNITVTPLKTFCSCEWYSFNVRTGKADHERAIAVLAAITKRNETT